MWFGFQQQRSLVAHETSKPFHAGDCTGTNLMRWLDKLGGRWQVVIDDFQESSLLAGPWSDKMMQSVAKLAKYRLFMDHQVPDKLMWLLDKHATWLYGVEGERWKVKGCHWVIFQNLHLDLGPYRVVLTGFQTLLIFHVPLQLYRWF